MPQTGAAYWGDFLYAHYGPSPVLWGGSVPFWAPLLVFATYPTIAIIRGPLRRRRRRKRGLCLECGYDLRGTTGGVCSECGEEIVRA